MGIEIAFGGDADFSAMTAEPDGLCIGDMLQQCFAKADELGA
jgi:serine protease inhibitor